MGMNPPVMAAARQVGVDVERTARRAGRTMTAAQLPGTVRDFVLVEGRVSPERAQKLYDDATKVSRAALRHLDTLAVDPPELLRAGNRDAQA